MEENFKTEIISPEKIIFSSDSRMVTLPSYEGEIGILRDHISIITFLRPGIIQVEKSKTDNNFFFIEDGIVEFFKNKLTVLTTSAINKKDLSKVMIENLRKKTEEKLQSDDLKDEQRYILNHKLNIISNLSL